VIQLLFFLVVLLISILSALAIRTIEKATIIACLLQNTTWAFLGIGLLLELILRTLIFRKRERLRVEQMFYREPTQKKDNNITLGN